MASLDLTITATTGRNFVPFLRPHLLAARGMLKSRLNELSVVLVGETRMARLHKQFMDIDSPTDVLTFPLELDRKSRPISGEIVVCAPVAHHRANQFGVPVRNELLLYALHGMLHLSGWDDRTAADFNRMHRMEDRILHRLGVGRVFRPARSKGRI